MFLPLYLTSRIFAWYRVPLQSSQGNSTSARNCISTVTVPSPSHVLHLPPGTLNEKCPGVSESLLASGCAANNSRTRSNPLIYVIGFERGVRPIGVWSTSTTSFSRSTPVNDLYTLDGSEPSLCPSARATARYSTWCTNVDFPDPETPVIATRSPIGISTSSPCRLLARAPRKTSISRPGVRRRVGTGIEICPDKYRPVSEFGLCSISARTPSANNLPPNSPAPGPRSSR